MVAVSLFVAGTLAVYQDPLAQPVDYTNPGTSAARIVSELAVQTGVMLKSADEAEKDIIALHTQGRPLQEVMDAIARVTVSRWNKIEGGYRLVPDIDKRKREAEAEAKHRDELVLTSIALRRQAASDPVEDDFDQEMQDMSLAWADILSKIPARPISSLGPMERIVFSSHPTKMQMPLPDISAAANALTARHNRLVGDISNGLTVMEPEDPGLREVMALQRKYSGYPTGKATAKPAKYNLIFTNTDSPIADLQNRLCELVIYDAQGKVIVKQTTFIQQQPVAMSFSNQGRTAEAERVAKILEVDLQKPIPLTLPKSALEVGAKGARGFSEETMEMLRHPTIYDPAGICTGAVLVEAGRKLNRPMAACLTEAFENLFGSTDTTALVNMLGYSQLKVESSQEWLDFTPHLPAINRSMRSDRAALERFVEAAKTGSPVSLDTLADYAAKNREFSKDRIAQIVMLAHLPSMAASSWGVVPRAPVNKWDVLRFFGRLSASQRRQVRNGTSLSFGSLNADQKAALMPLLYNDGNIPFYAEPGDEDRIRRSFGHLTAQWIFGAMKSGTFRDEQTEASPLGITADGLIDIDISNEHCFMPVSAENQMLTQYSTFSLSQLALLNGVSQLYEDAGRNNPIPRIDRGRVGQRLEMTLLIRPYKGTTYRQVLVDDSFKDSKAYLLNQLPGDAASAYQSALTESDLLRKLMMGNGGSGQDNRRP